MLSGDEVEGGKRVRLGLATQFYEGDISVHAILSYQWLVENCMMVNPARHGIIYRDERSQIFFAGIKPPLVAPVTVTAFAKPRKTRPVTPPCGAHAGGHPGGP